ncbi:pilus assembly protein TadG-related protein [Dankookia sp. GCM10030260]|uniref:pilus assembly protein TadG-related protein n=1 Tax=Dankookia sp. GCM10030260 TaxID=3273390 RepID=UPI003623459B
MKRLGRRGNIAMLVALLAVPLVGMVGIATDGARAWLLRSRMHTALDAAALAGARNIALPAAQRDAEVAAMFWTNYGVRGTGYTPAQATGHAWRGFLDASTTLDPPMAVDASTMRVSARAVLDTTFARVMGFGTLTVAASAEARRADMGMELALVLDVTGSMGSNKTPSPVGSATTNGTNIDALRLAASDLVTILYGTRETVPNLWVSVVPYTTTVNIAPQRTGWLDPGSRDLARYAPRGWMGCVEARAATGNDQTDAPPGVEAFKPFFWASTLGKYTLRTGGAVPGDNDWAASLTGTNGITEMYQDVRENNTAGPNTGCPQAPILPLTAARTSVLNRIMALRSTFKGGTMHNTGMQAGWFTLSPRWRGLWTTGALDAGADSSPATLPLNYGTQYMQKVVVLMTDGQANWNDWNGGAPGDCSDTSTSNAATPAGAPPLRPLGCPRNGYPASVTVAAGAPPIQDAAGNNNSDYSGYGRRLENRLGIAPPLTAARMTTELNTRMTNLCTAMKRQGIVVYTVTFNLADAATQALFRGCASQPDYWFNSPTQADLRNAFRQIGSQLANLRLVQ